jgi:hypothetical protein
MGHSELAVGLAKAGADGSARATVAALVKNHSGREGGREGAKGRSGRDGVSTLT